MIDDDLHFDQCRIKMTHRNTPLGFYYAYVDPDETRITKTRANKKCIIWNLVILGPTHVNISVKKWSILEGPALSYTKGDFFALGFNIQSKNDINRALRQLRNACLNIEITDSGREYININFLSKCKPDEIEMGTFEYLQNIFWKNI